MKLTLWKKHQQNVAHWLEEARWLPEECPIYTIHSHPLCDRALFQFNQDLSKITCVEMVQTYFEAAIYLLPFTIWEGDYYDSRLTMKDVYKMFMTE